MRCRHNLLQVQRRLSFGPLSALASHLNNGTSIAARADFLDEHNKQNLEATFW